MSIRVACPIRSHEYANPSLGRFGKLSSPKAEVPGNETLTTLESLHSGDFWAGNLRFQYLGRRGGGRVAATPSRATQAWRSISDEKLLCIERDRIWSPSQSAVKILVIEHRDPRRGRSERRTLLKTWKVSQQAKTLRTEVSGTVTDYKNLHSVPAACAFRVVSVGQPREISKERAESVSREIHERMLKDQKAMQAGVFGPSSPVIIENRKYLEGPDPGDRLDRSSPLRA